MLKSVIELNQKFSQPVAPPHHQGFYKPPQNFGNYWQQTYMQPAHIAGAYPTMHGNMASSFYPAQHAQMLPQWNTASAG